MWGTSKCLNIYIMGVSEGEEKGAEKLSKEIIDENSPNLTKRNKTKHINLHQFIKLLGLGQI